MKEMIVMRLGILLLNKSLVNRDKKNTCMVTTVEPHSCDGQVWIPLPAEGVCRRSVRKVTVDHFSEENMLLHNVT